MFEDDYIHISWQLLREIDTCFHFVIFTLLFFQIQGHCLFTHLNVPAEQRPPFSRSSFYSWNSLWRDFASPHEEKNGGALSRFKSVVRQVTLSGFCLACARERARKRVRRRKGNRKRERTDMVPYYNFGRMCSLL